METYVVDSLGTHLFFCRIMKEHALFLLASFPEKERSYRNEADWYRNQFEMALDMAVRLADRNVRSEVLESGEVATEHTEMAEGQTSQLTGIPIRIQITRNSKRLQSGSWDSSDRNTMQQVRNLNRRIMQLLRGLISLKERILRDVGSCRLYTANYPLLIEHILREARLYQQTLMDIENGKCVSTRESVETEDFWNQIMMEHAEFIRGLLDPTEYELMETADGFVREYACLLEMADKRDSQMKEEMSRKAMELTERYQEFKDAGTEGITGCQIRSVILPLLADHVLREANHYLRLLKE